MDKTSPTRGSKTSFFMKLKIKTSIITIKFDNKTNKNGLILVGFKK